MKNPPNNQNVLFLLLKSSILQFIAGVLSLLIVLKIANNIDYIVIQVILKVLGYSFFCYLTTPFVIYWLAYASDEKLTAKNLLITIALTALYSFVVWDAYFFFREAIARLLF